MIYLAIPYTWNPEKSFEIANKVAAELMLKGNVVFSPISHSHPISLHMTKEQQIDHDLWMKQDLPMLLKAKKLVIIDLGQELTRNSRGLQKEIKTARDNHIPIAYYRYKEHGNNL